MRVLQRNNRYNHHPFPGRGASLYAGIGATGDSIQFRKMRVLGNRFVRGSGFTIGDGLRKCTFVAQTNDPTAQFNYTFPPEWASSTVWIQVRTFWDHCENAHNADPVRLDFDGDGELETEIHCTGSILGADKRDGGIYRLRCTYIPVGHGLQPTSLLIRKTAGTGTLADVSVTILRDVVNYNIDTAALVDGATYTFALFAKNGSTELQLDTITFTADAAGPPAATDLTLTAT